ncbi:MAG: cytochrome b N-terminal domain-containing protein [Rickettsiella sp.]|nr:cytochrome b N-terminal domain-containing protein [Rickettsiella sp.]
MTFILNWFFDRLPITRFLKNNLTHYYLPSNLNFWYIFGSLSLFLLALQILSGIWLMMFYTPTPEAAFNSIEMMMRDVPYGWLFRYLHTTGASFFFIIIYCHIFRSLLYGSYKKPRELVWIIGVTLYIALLSEAFIGYLLPWGQMSYWASQIATSLWASIPGVGPYLMLWMRGNSVVSSETLHRFFALHTTGIPLFLLFLVWLHLKALRKVGSNNPDGISHSLKTHKKFLTKLPFHPYYTIKDLFALAVFLVIFCAVVFFTPEMEGYFIEPNNFIPANPLITPSHIVPLWYLAPFYGMLCIIPNKLFGILTMILAVVILFTLPWLDRSPINSLRYRGRYSRTALGIFTISFGLLSYLSMTVLTPIKITFMQFLAINYFLFFYLMPIYTSYEKNKSFF